MFQKALPPTLSTIHTHCSNSAGRGSETVSCNAYLNSSANLHLNYVNVITNLHLFLHNQLRREGVDINGLAKVFLSGVIACFLYALPLFSGMITADDINRINSVFCKAKKWGLTNIVPSVEKLCENADRKLFKAMMWWHHCLHTLLSPARYTCGRNMRERGQHFQLPIAKTNNFQIVQMRIVCTIMFIIYISF